MIMIYFIETEDFIKNIISETIYKSHYIDICESEDQADIILKIDGYNCHFYGFSSYLHLEFPCKFYNFINSIKKLYYSHNKITRNNFCLKHDILTYKDHKVKLSDNEASLILKLLELYPNGIEKNLLGSPIENTLYRLRKKLIDINADIKVESSTIYLKDNN